MGGTHGLADMPKKPFDFLGIIHGRNMNLTLLSLSNFYFTGLWAASAGTLIMIALSGQKLVQRICKEENKRFITPINRSRRSMDR